MSTRASKAASGIIFPVLLFAFATFLGSAEKPDSPVLEFSPKRGFYEKPFTLTLHSSDPALSIRYTKDGAEPTKASRLLSSQPLTIGNTTIIRAALFRGATRVSAISTHSYIFLDQVIRQPNAPAGWPRAWNGFPSDYEMDPKVALTPEYRDRIKGSLLSLPTVSVALSQDDLFGSSRGIYLHSMEHGMDWERSCSAEMILPDGATAFQVSCGLRIQGNSNRIPQKSTKHSFRLLFREKYGTAKLHYPVFPDSPLKKFDTLVLRADYNNSWIHWDARARPRGQRTRDAWMKDTHRAMGWVASHNRYVHLYLNGLYWGIYDFAERPDAEFAAAYLGGKKEDYDVINDFQVKDGKRDAFDKLRSIQGMANPTRYEAIGKILDVPQFIDYVLLNYYVGNQDWGENKNWYAIRNRANNGRFQYVVWDGEQILHDVTDDSVSSPYEVPFRMEKDLETNPEYRLAFADAVHKHCFNGGALTPQACIDRWMKWAAQVDTAVIAESARWGDFRRKVPFTRDKEWLAEQRRLVTRYFPQRTNILLQQLKEVGLYPPIDAPEISGSPGGQLQFKVPAKGKIYYALGGADPRTYGTGKPSATSLLYTKPIPVEHGIVVKARALDGSIWSALAELSIK